MASTTSTRMWRTLRSAGRPWPVLSDDPVVDYQIMEAVALKVAQEDEKLREEAEKAAEKKKWKEDKSDLLNATGQG